MECPLRERQTAAGAFIPRRAHSEPLMVLRIFRALLDTFDGVLDMVECHSRNVLDTRQVFSFPDVDGVLAEPLLSVKQIFLLGYIHGYIDIWIYRYICSYVCGYVPAK